MEIQKLELSGLFVVKPKIFGDERGFFTETFRLNELENAVGKKIVFVQNNHSRSVKGTLRGIHAESWDKLIYVPRGEVFVALTDLRRDSETYKKTISMNIGDSNRILIFIPEGFGNSMQVLSDDADYFYQVTKYYDGSDTKGVAWNDNELSINWPIIPPLLSERDQNNPTLSESEEK